PGLQFLECASYNFQPAYFDQALDLVYAEMDLDKGKLLLYDGYQWGEGGSTLNSVWGYGYEYMDPPAWGAWNASGHYRELSYNQENSINPIPIKTESEINYYLKEYEKVYYLELPWGDDLIDKLKEQYSSMFNIKTIKHHGWVLNLYIFENS
ncbi:MAG: hypothetical protein NC489_44405, partial [Ruminococcus flavefaciens]|nr:hypothetical protein [Ruminococcus flavefaciens]